MSSWPACSAATRCAASSDGLEGDLVEIGQTHAVGVLLPVVGVLLDHQLLVDRPVVELERPGTDEVAVAVRAGELGRGDDEETTIDVEEPGELGPRRRGRDRELERAVDRHVRRCPRARRRAAGWCGRRSKFWSDGVGVERRSVLELDAVAEHDRPLGEVGVGRHRLRQVGDHLRLGVGHHQRVVDGGADLDARDRELGGGGAPSGAGLGLEPVGDGAARLRRCGRADALGNGGEQRGGAGHGGGHHDDLGQAPAQGRVCDVPARTFTCSAPPGIAHG